MSDRELVEELTEHARELEDADGGVNPFLIQEHELLMKAAQRLSQLSASPPAQGQSTSAGQSSSGFSTEAAAIQRVVR